MTLVTNLHVGLLFVGIVIGLECEEGYDCYTDPTTNVVWVRKHTASSSGPTCKQVCEQSLFNNNEFYTCDITQQLYHNYDSFKSIADGLNFTCKTGNCGGTTGAKQIRVSRGLATGDEKECFFPRDDVIGTFSCDSHPGNANCFGRRYTLICPCVSKPLHQACSWTTPPYYPVQFGLDWGQRGANVHNASCLDRINWWRKKACDEGWPECPKQGLPPMTECICGHRCANSQSEYDRQFGAHKSFKRCAIANSQGSGSGSSCARVIDAFVAQDRKVYDKPGIVECKAHCGPIVSSGCHEFQWGQFKKFYTLNWRNCNTGRMDAYCENPTDNACFDDPDDINPFDITNVNKYDILQYCYPNQTLTPTTQPSLSPTVIPTRSPLRFNDTLHPTLKPTPGPNTLINPSNAHIISVYSIVFITIILNVIIY